MKISNFCNLGCGIAAVFLFGMVYMTLTVNKNEVSERFKRTLDKSQLERYERLTNERLQIYYTGYGVGFLISLGLIYLNVLVLKQKMTKMSMVCLTSGVSFLTTYFYYILSRKSDYMIMHIKEEDQKREWLNVYRVMQYHYHMGLVLGIAAVMAISYGFC